MCRMYSYIFYYNGSILQLCLVPEAGLTNYLRSVLPQVWNFVSHLPIINVHLSIKGWWDGSVQGQNELPIPTLATDMRDEKKWIKLHADQEYVLQIYLQRIQMGYHQVEYS